MIPSTESPRRGKDNLCCCKSRRWFSLTGGGGLGVGSETRRRGRGFRRAASPVCTVCEMRCTVHLLCVHFSICKLHISNKLKIYSYLNATPRGSDLTGLRTELRDHFSLVGFLKSSTGDSRVYPAGYPSELTGWSFFSVK